MTVQDGLKLTMKSLWKKCLTRSERCVASRMLLALHLELKSEVGQNLYSLYDYIIQRLTDANIQNSLKIMDEVITLMLPIKNAWAQIPESAKQEAYEAQRQKRQAAVWI